MSRVSLTIKPRNIVKNGRLCPICGKGKLLHSSYSLFYCSKCKEDFSVTPEGLYWLTKNRDIHSGKEDSDISCVPIRRFENEKEMRRFQKSIRGET